MARLTRTKIIPANSENAGTVEKWAIPDMRTAHASIVNLDDARKRSADNNRRSQSTNSQLSDAAANISATSEAAFEAGYKDGIRAAKDQYAERQQQLEYLIQILENPVSGLGDAVASELVSLSVEIARSVLNREIQQNPEQIVEFVSAAMSQLPTADKPVQITVHPEDLHTIKSHSVKDLGQYNIQWVDDSSVIRGSFNISQDASDIHGGIDAMLTTVLEQLNLNVDPQ